MLHRLLSPHNYVELDTQPDILLFVENALCNDPSGMTITFSAYDAYAGIVVLDHLAAGVEDITSEVDICTGETVWSFKLRHVLTGVLDSGIYECQFSLDGTWHIPVIAFRLRVVKHGF